MNAQTNLTTAQDFTVTDVHGTSHNLFTYLDSNKHVILDFFFTTCGPCINSIPTISASFTAFGCNTGDVIFLSIDADDTDAEVLQFELDWGIIAITIQNSYGDVLYLKIYNYYE